MNPSPETIRASRKSSGLTQSAAARLIHAAERTWQDWEAGKRNMPQAKFDLFLILSRK